jgi:cellulose synthase/poly-beta-1,6-N-acetylglucosamine synthase-like glycosyltransferase
MPYTHLRTFTRKLIDYVDDAEFMNAEGQWYRAGGDNAVFYALIEQADPTKVKAVKHIHYYYNDTNPSNDYKINQTEQTKTANEIVNRPIQELKDRTIEQASVELKLETVDSLPTTNIAPTLNTKRILAAIPTAKNIEVETFKSIFDQVVPANHKLEFQYFYGYNIDQVRNLIAHWTIINGFDYLLSVDSDIVLPTDALGKMLTADKDIVSGIYIQRKHDVKIPEIYLKNQHGGVTNAPLAMLQHNNLMEIDGCGFGCALIKTNVLKDIGYPQFVYHDTLDFQYTVSEDVDFCRKAKDKGFRIFADCSIRCEHIGSHKFTV